jgi:hypothetical protein
MDTPAYRQRFDDAIGASHGGDDENDDRRNRAMRERFSQAEQQSCN